MIAAGLIVMTVTEAATLFGIEPFATWNTPIAWTGFIVFADGVVFKLRGRSWLRSAPGEMVWLALASIALWLVFEGYNLIIRNWYYTGLPRNLWVRDLGLAWSFATIWPAIFEGAELVGAIRGRRSPERGLAGAGGYSERRTAQASFGRSLQETFGGTPVAAVSVAVGAVMLLVPFLVPAGVAPYLAGPVWLGFIFLLDPINRRLGAEGITRDRLINLSASGVLCGILWEFWNYWAASKWHYTVPFMANLRIFEMPVPGYLGFPAFALECFTMYVFVRAALGRSGRRIAL